MINRIIILLLMTLNLIGCSNENETVLSGYIEGEYNYIASGISGTLIELAVTRGQTIKENDLLFKLDPEPEKATMEAAKASVGELEARVALAKIQLARHQDLYTHNATDKSTLDQKQTEYDTELKQLLAAQKRLSEAQWTYQQKTVYAPISGLVFDTYYRLGEKVIANQPVLSLLEPKNIKVQFYIPEKQLSAIHLNQTITFRCDNCQTTTKATITYISPEAEYTPPIIYSQNTRYKLVYKVRADLSPTVATQFHPGQPLDVYLNEP